MKRSDAQEYPVENMSLVYADKTKDVYQAIFQTKNFGTFTRVDGKWRALSSEDTSLENLLIIDILPEDYKEVTAMFDAAQKANRYLKYDEVKDFEVGYSFDGSAEALSKEEIEKGPLSKGFHAFRECDSTLLEIERNRTDGSGELPRIYSFRSKPELRYYKINGTKILTHSKVIGGELLLSITYKLVSTSDAAEFYSLRQLHQIGEQSFVYFESSYCKFYGQEIDQEKEKIQNLEGLILREDLERLLECFTLWLVEVDPIGFELLRRMNRDGFTEELVIVEDLTKYHDSDSLMDIWLNKMTDYADSMELRIEVNTENRKFMLPLKYHVSDANSHTKSDFFGSYQREEWMHPSLRVLDDEDTEDLTEEKIDQLRREALARKKVPERIKFLDVPPTLQQLIHDMIQRVEEKIGEEDGDVCSADLKGFIAGRYGYTEVELSAQLAKHLRMLT